MLNDLTPDEHVMRTYYLNFEPNRYRQIVGELPYLAPVVIIALLPRQVHDVNLLVALVYLLGVYFWRMGGVKWLLATSGLVKKYESQIAELQQRLKEVE